MEVTLDEAAVKVVVKKMASFRPSLTEAEIRKIIAEWKDVKDLSMAGETAQDVVWAYREAISTGGN